MATKKTKGHCVKWSKGKTRCLKRTHTARRKHRLGDPGPRHVKHHHMGKVCRTKRGHFKSCHR